MHLPWGPVQDRLCYGVVRWCMEERKVHPLAVGVEVGDPVLIKGELEDWFYVKKVYGEAEGILPKAFVHIKECSVIRNGDTDIVLPKQPPLAQEIVASLQEWYKIAKQLYVQANVRVEGVESRHHHHHHHESKKGSHEKMDVRSKFETIRKLILELHEKRKRLLSSNLTKEGLKDVRKEVATVIDSGNSLLRLDMIVRDELGNPLDPLSTSTIQLFRQHKRSSVKLKKSSNRGSHRGSNPPTTHSSHSLIVTVNSINWRVVDECEVRFFLCDTSNDEPTHFSESVQVSLRNGQKLPSFKFLFTDLGKTDFERPHIYLVAYVVRIGPMDFKETEGKSREHGTPFGDKRNNIQVKRPYGVAAQEITHLIRSPSCTPKTEADNEVQTLLYLPCNGEDSMEDTLKKLIGTGKVDPNGKDAKAVGFVVRLIMVPGNPKQIQEEQPVLMVGNPIISRKMGFPEVILPNDTRNDLYIKLIRGEFHRTAKTADRNVEVTISVHNDRGGVLKGILWSGNGGPGQDGYRSVVYYHNEKPRWNDWLKIMLPMNIEEFSTAHIKFTFKHRSSTDAKDRAEKPFALAYLRLKEHEGTAIRDGTYELILYKIDPKYYKDTEVQYLSLPYMKSPTWVGMSKPSCPGFSCSSKDIFYVKTALCSTNFTQNPDLLQLLLWVTKLRQVAELTVRDQPDITADGLCRTLLDNLKGILDKVTKVSGEEIVKFLHPILDALFLILVDPMEQISTELRSGGRQSVYGQLLNAALAEGEVSCERHVFDCLLHIFCLILDHKFQNFQSVLNLYIEENFSSTLAYKKLAKELKWSIEHDQPEKVLKVMKSIEYFFKFIIKSFEIHKRLRYFEFGRTDQDRDDDEGFERTIEGLFKAMAQLLKRKVDKNDHSIGAAGGCLKHIPGVIEDLVRVFPARRLSEHLVELCCVLPPKKLTSSKLTFITEIIHSQLFIDMECRFNLLPTVTTNILSHLPGHDERRKSAESSEKEHRLRKFFGVKSLEASPAHDRSSIKDTSAEEAEKCVELFGDMMDILHGQPDEAKLSHIWYIMQILLRPILHSIKTIPMNDPLAGNMVAIFLSLLREMKNYHYTLLIDNLKRESGGGTDPYKHNLLRFLNDVLLVIRGLFHQAYFSSDWAMMTLLQNSIVVKTLEHLAATIKAEFAEPFEEGPWTEFFLSAVAFLTQPALQLETFPSQKLNYVLGNFGDMRKKAAELIRLMWFSLGESKRIRFVPEMVGTFLDMALVPEPDLRRTTIPIFFDMMHCEFDQDRPLKSFKDVEDELLKKLVEGIESCKGDTSFRDIFSHTMTELCVHNNTGLRHAGLSMVSMLTTLMDLLLQYREIEEEEDPGNRMSCLVNLLDFSKEMGRKELYLRYLYKLHDLHIRSKNYTEAGFTMKLHSQQLDWSEDEVPLLLRVPTRHPSLIVQADLKEALYQEIITSFNEAKMWECALEICDELKQQYEDTFSYSKLPILHRQIASFYQKILEEPRFKREYFRVAFYGGGFPSFLRDKIFVYRGHPLEQLPEFEGRMLGQFVQGELLRNLGLPSDEIRNSNKQYLQICKVDAIMGTGKRLSGMRYTEENIVSYYKSNEIEQFTYSRPYHVEPRDPNNEHASLWLDRYTLTISQSFPGIMAWFPVIRETLTKVTPIQKAIEELENVNETIRKMVLDHSNNPALDLGDMTMRLNGVIDAAVNGGVANYEKAFLLNRDYLESHPEDAPLVEKLKKLILQQIPILDEALKVDARKIQQSMQPLHFRMEEVFKETVAKYEATYLVNAKNLMDDVLVREMDRAAKKREAMSKRVDSSRDQRHGENYVAGHRGSVIGRSMGSFPSATSLYQNATNGRSVGRSMATISQRSIFRRSGHSSFSGSMEGDQLTGYGGSGGHIHSSTLPRPHPSISVPASLSKLQAVEPETETLSQDNESLIPLTQTLVPHRPPRKDAEHRNSWANGSGSSRVSSDISLDTLRPSHSEPSSCSPDSALGEEAPPPPIPPKQSKDKELPPPPPPKKPPHKPYREI